MNTEMSEVPVPRTNLRPEERHFFALPAIGSIVWSHFPHQEEIIEGKTILVRQSPRPALVVGIAEYEGKPYVIVIPGTTKKTEPGNIYPSEFVIRSTDDDYIYTGLSLDTKFKLEREIKLPYSNDFFSIPKHNPGSKTVPTSPRIGVLPSSYLTALRNAALNVKRQNN